MLKPFGVTHYYDYGMRCGVVMAESEEEVKEILKEEGLNLNNLLKDEEVIIVKIDPTKKEYFGIGEFEE